MNEPKACDSCPCCKWCSDFDYYFDRGGYVLCTKSGKEEHLEFDEEDESYNDKCRYFDIDL